MEREISGSVRRMMEFYRLPPPPSLFKQWYLGNLQNAPTINYVNAILTTDGKWFWLGLNPYGIALYNRDTGDTYYNKGIPGFGKLSSYTLTTSITSIVKRSNDEIWFAVNNYGVIIKPKEKEAFCLDNTNTNYIKENFVNAVFESKDKTMWIGSRNGMSIVYPDNTGYFLTMKEGKNDFSSCDIRNICQDRQGNIWVSTDNEGIIRISGNTRNIRSLKYRQYCPKTANMPLTMRRNAWKTIKVAFGLFQIVADSSYIIRWKTVLNTRTESFIFRMIRPSL